uniref:GOLD domain-containing protein n=1 Tax=Anopheles minimus TaxID=112268 RepID=A0A182VT41_9DIPT
MFPSGDQTVTPKNQTVTLEFQVVTGGRYDVDVTLESPTSEVIYKQIKKQFDSTAVSIHRCNLQVGEEHPLPGMENHATVLTQMETVTKNIHKDLNSILDYQTHPRLQVAQGRKRAEDLNERVLWWSVSETVCILFIAIGQVFLLRNFFSEKKPRQRNYPLKTTTS